MHNKYLIIGLGWLGSPLATHLKSAGHKVSGTTRNKDKANQFELRKIQAHLFDLYENDDITIAPEAFENANIIINIAPGRLTLDKSLFVKRMTLLMEYAYSQSARHICFISTTSVYGGATGEINNTSAFCPNTKSGEAHVEIEKFLKTLVLQDKAQNSCAASVLRLAGLASEDRHPIRTLSQKSNITLGNNPVNLVHRSDVINAIIAIVNATSTETMNNSPFYAANLCSVEHPSRQQYYTWCAQQKELRIPHFAEDSRSLVDGKWINAKATLKALKLTLEYPSPYNMV